MANSSVAVIGLGAMGLVTLKNMIERGFDATGFEKSASVGGLWNFNDGDQTSVLESTITNISKQRGCFTDFPFLDGASTFPKSHEVAQYLNDYSKHFGLSEHMQLGAEVTRLSFDEGTRKWTVDVQKGGSLSTLVFDRVILATGINKLPLVPKFEGVDNFAGEIFHSNSYKRPELFKDKTVIVVGMSNSAADTATTLVGHAKQVYISRRHDTYVLPRYINGVPMDHTFSHRKGAIVNSIKYVWPSMAETMSRRYLGATTKDSFAAVPSGWDLEHAPSPFRAPPIVSDTLIPEILDGKIALLGALKGITGPRTIHCVDGKEVDVDAIILCTGYQSDYSLAGRLDPTRDQPAAWTAATGSNSRRLARMYMNVFSLDVPQHLAFMGGVAFATPIFQIADLASMAVARVWAGDVHLPPVEEMSGQVDSLHAWLARLAAEGTVIPAWIDGGEWMAWADRMAGCGVFARLGFGWHSWALWWNDRELWKILVDGVSSPHVFRLFDTGYRKAWDGARREILRINER